MKNAFLISQITITICLLTGLCGIGQGWAQTNTTADLGISLMNVTPSSAQPGTFILEATVTNLGPDDTGLVKGTIQESFELLEFINVKAN
ncbi:MAG: hypothetical protein KIT39_21195, partial [Nitrospirales bacterium]|nr:hypothetical protein [Nitrospirales bacterium]